MSDPMLTVINIKDQGAVCDGLTNDTGVLNKIILEIADSISEIQFPPTITLIIPGPTRFAGDLTFGDTTQVAFWPGAALIGSGTENVIFQMQVIAGAHNIFRQCKTISSRPQAVCPEWWIENAARDGEDGGIISAYNFLVNTGGGISLQPRPYEMRGELNIPHPCKPIALVGSGVQITILSFTNDSDGIYLAGDETEFIGDMVFRGFTLISRQPTAKPVAGINAFNAKSTVFEDIEVNGFLQGIVLSSCPETKCTRVGASHTWPFDGFRGFQLICGNPQGGGNASSVFRDCWVEGINSGSTNAYDKVGFTVRGSNIADLIFDSCSTARMDYGFDIDGIDQITTYTRLEDVHVLNCIVDQYTKHGILVANMNANTGAMMTIRGGWINPSPVRHSAGGGDNMCGIRLVGCNGGISIVNVQIQDDHPAATNVVGVGLERSSNVKVAQCLFGGLKAGYGVAAMGTGGDPIPITDTAINDDNIVVASQ